MEQIKSNQFFIINTEESIDSENLPSIHTVKWSRTEKLIIKNIESQNFRQSIHEDISKQYSYVIDKNLSACLHFIQDQFGSAFCVSEDGKILTCAHCILNEEGKPEEQIFYLIFPDSTIVQCYPICFDQSLDLALLQIVEFLNKSQFEGEKGYKQTKYPYIQIAKFNEQSGKAIFCIGQPGYDNLETQKAKKTHYNPFFVSQGKVKGYLQDEIYVDSNRDLGPLMHSCWTYWGHSGAPIFNSRGEIVGVHNSWNDQNAMRHGLSALTIQNFREQCNQNGIKF